MTPHKEWMTKGLMEKSGANIFSEKFSSFAGDMRKTWTLIGLSLNQTKLKILHNSFLIDGVETSDRSVVADEFNNYFVNIGKNLSTSIPES